MLSDFIKEYFRHYKVEFIICMLLVGSFFWLDYTFGCAYKLGPIVVYGNCGELTWYQNNIRYNLSFTPSADDVFITTPTTTLEIVKCPLCDVCPVEKVCPPPFVIRGNESCPAPTVCPKRECPVGLTAEQNHTIMNLRWEHPTSDCMMAGYQVGLTDCRYALGLAKTYNGKPVYGSYYKPVVGSQVINDSMYCFLKQEGSEYMLDWIRTGFFLNISQWGFNNTYESYETYNETKVLYTHSTDTSNFTYWKNFNITDVLWNKTDNLFVYRLK